MRAGAVPDGPIHLQGPQGQAIILGCSLAVEGVHQDATVRVWRENGGKDVGLTIALEENTRIGFACSFDAKTLPVLFAMMQAAAADSVRSTP